MMGDGSSRKLARKTKGRPDLPAAHFSAMDVRLLPGAEKICDGASYRADCISHAMDDSVTEIFRRVSQLVESLVPVAVKEIRGRLTEVVHGFTEAVGDVSDCARHAARQVGQWLNHIL